MVRKKQISAMSSFFVNCFKGILSLIILNLFCVLINSFLSTIVFVGAIEFILIPNLPRSNAADLVKPSIANLDEQYAVLL